MERGPAFSLRWRLLTVGLAAAAVVAVAACEALGWPFLAAPMQRWLGDALERRVTLGAHPDEAPRVAIRLFGGIELSTGYLEIGAPAWSTAPHTLLARDAQLSLGYADLWRASRGAPLHIRGLRAAQLDATIERLADGRASWQLGKQTDTADTASLRTHAPVFGRLQVNAGQVAYRDAMTAVSLDARFTLVEGEGDVAPGAASAPAAGLKVQGTGDYRGRPLRVEARTSGVLPLIANAAGAPALPVSLNAQVGRASLVFEGTASDVLHLSALKGRFSLQGPSLAAVGDPLGVTLPTTGPFSAKGQLAKQGAVWNTVFERINIGASRLAGAFIFDPRPQRPLLAGRLTGTQLALVDLGPAVGAPVAKAAPPASSRAASGAANRTLPDRDFDLPSLRAMDANVLFDIDRLDLGTQWLEPLQPLRTHLVLADGVLALNDIDARTGQGHLGGTLQLDGRSAQALWTADLRWDGVRLEQWIRQPRANNAPPYATGILNGKARVAGQGKSTAAILGSLNGAVRMQWVDGAISHLAVEAAGLDIAQSLGALMAGDDALPVECGIADMAVEQGVLRPRVLVLDTSDSTLWVDGSLSLATEQIDLRVVTAPKDFSPLAPRTPIRLRGSLANPDVSLEAGKLGTRVGAAALLALVNPLAALIPLMDVGNSADAKRGGDACRALVARVKAQPALPAPRSVTPARAALKPTSVAPVH